jgi:hypothetical protein
MPKSKHRRQPGGKAVSHPGRNRPGRPLKAWLDDDLLPKENLEPDVDPGCPCSIGQTNRGNITFPHLVHPSPRRPAADPLMPIGARRLPTIIGRLPP